MQDSAWQPRGDGSAPLAATHRHSQELRQDLQQRTHTLPRAAFVPAAVRSRRSERDAPTARGQHLTLSTAGLGLVLQQRGSKHVPPLHFPAVSGDTSFPTCGKGDGTFPLCSPLRRSTFISATHNTPTSASRSPQAPRPASHRPPRNWTAGSHTGTSLAPRPLGRLWVPAFPGDTVQPPTFTAPTGPSWQSASAAVRSGPGGR